MRALWSTTHKDLLRRLRDPLALLIWLGVPFAILGMLTLAFGMSGDDIKPQAHLLVADADDSFLSGLLVSALGQGQLAELVRTESVDEVAGRSRIRGGDGSALLIIPAGFSEAVLEEEPSTLTLLTNPSQRILPGILEELLSVLVDGTFYAQRVLGEPLREIAAGADAGGSFFTDQQVASISVQVNQSMERLSGYLFPPLIQLETAVESTERAASANLGTLFFQGMFFMALFFSAQGMSDDFWKEKQQGTLSRYVTTPSGLAALLGGKLLAGAIVFAGLTALSLAAGGWVYGLEAIRLPLAALWATFSATLLLAAFTLVQLFASSQRTGNILAGVVTFPLLMLGGSFFPFEAMPEFLAKIGRWTPNGWALEQFKAILGGTVEPARLTAAFGGLVVVGVLIFVLSLRRLRRRFVLG